ncbi:GAF and ANTAR domain-containing protein [Angustibacter peucedani]
MSTDDPLRGTVALTFAELARLFHESSGLDEICAAICRAAPQLVPGCDHASIMVKAGDGYRTLASSDEVGAKVDLLERECGEGPCVDAIESDAYQLDADIQGHSQWPRLAERVLAETPVRGMAGYRLLVGGHKTGALNLFSDTAGALTGESADQGVVLAAFASVAMGGESHRAEAVTLAAGLESNREIGTAIGLLMAAHGLTADDAFETLRRASSHLNRKLAAIAREIIEQGPPKRS